MASKADNTDSLFENIRKGNPIMDIMVKMGFKHLEAGAGAGMCGNISLFAKPIGLICGIKQKAERYSWISKISIRAVVAYVIHYSAASAVCSH